MQNLLGIFKALSEETRLRIVKLLEHGELCVCDIVAALHMVQPKVSFHLAALKEAGFIKDRKQGKWTHYRIDAEDMFRRMLVLSVTEKIDNKSVAKDLSRLNDFISSKPSKEKVVSLKDKKRCYGE